MTSLGLQSGVVGSVNDPMVSDGLFIPAPFDSHTAYASASGSAALLTGLTARASGRISTTRVPGQPIVDQGEGVVGLSYTYGGLEFGVEDRLGFAFFPTGTVLTNTFMVRVYRVVGPGR